MGISLSVKEPYSRALVTITMRGLVVAWAPARILAVPPALIARVWAGDSHDLDGELSIQVLEGEGFFLGEKDSEIQAKKGDILISEIREPHGVRAKTQMRILVTIAPPIL